MKIIKSDRLRSYAGWVKNTSLDPYFWSKSQNEFQQRLANVTTLEDTIDLIWMYKGAGFYRNLKPNQDRWELTTLAQRVHALHPQVIVEIGTRFGGTLLTWSQCADSLQLLVSIDLPGGIHGGGYPIQRARLYNLFVTNKPLCRIELLRTNSQTKATRTLLTGLLQDRPIDFLFIDGDHRFEGVKRDYELYSPLVRVGGLIAFHDIRPQPTATAIQVSRLWDEITAATTQTEEIIHSPYSGRYGIGVLTKK